MTIPGADVGNGEVDPPDSEDQGDLFSILTMSQN